jgi:hypothetical protein
MMTPSGQLPALGDPTVTGKRLVKHEAHIKESGRAAMWKFPHEPADPSRSGVGDVSYHLFECRDVRHGQRAAGT